MISLPRWLKLVWILLIVYVLVIFYLFWIWGFSVVRPF